MCVFEAFGSLSVFDQKRLSKRFLWKRGMIDYRTNYPAGMRSGDEDRRESEDDRDFWEALWDHAHRYEEENRRDYD